MSPEKRKDPFRASDSIKASQVQWMDEVRLEPEVQGQCRFLPNLCLRSLQIILLHPAFLNKAAVFFQINREHVSLLSAVYKGQFEKTALFSSESLY